MLTRPRLRSTRPKATSSSWRSITTARSPGGLRRCSRCAAKNTCGGVSHLDTPPAYWSYLRRYPQGPHAWDARRRLVILRAQIEAPSSFAMVDFAIRRRRPTSCALSIGHSSSLPGQYFRTAAATAAFLLAPRPREFATCRRHRHPYDVLSADAGLRDHAGLRAAAPDCRGAAAAARRTAGPSGDTRVRPECRPSRRRPARPGPAADRRCAPPHPLPQVHGAPPPPPSAAVKPTPPPPHPAGPARLSGPRRRPRRPIPRVPPRRR